MIKNLFLILAVCSSLLQSAEISDFINEKNCDQVIDKQVFSICYDYKAKGAKYVAYELNRELVNQGNIKERDSFYSESTIPVQYRSKSNDYTNSGYDRGHLASDASFDYDKKALAKTYTMANIIPQSPMVNRKTWIKAEKYERLIAAKLGSVIVINGVNYSNNPKRIGKNKIAVPDSFWKMLINEKAKFAKCFLYQNNENVDYANDKLEDHEVSCGSLINM